MADPVALHRGALAAFEDRLVAVRADQWDAATPCEGWNVRDLVNHVVAGNLWVTPLLTGQRHDEVAGLDGDALGDDPVGAFEVACDAALAAFDRPEALQATVHASYGSFPGEVYAWQRFADVLVHAWDLAVAIGADARLPDEQVEALATWFDGVEETYRGGGFIGARVPVAADADAQTHLLARFGRSPRAAVGGRAT
jgi:uncharacterized protein (TIGR03086 family)